MATFWDILWAIKGEFTLVALGLFFGAVPTFWDMRRQDNMPKRPLTTQGKIVACIFFILLPLSGFFLYQDKKAEFEKEHKADKRAKLDSISQVNLSKKIDSVKNELVSFAKSDSVYKSALNKGGYKLINGKIVSPQQNIQKIEKDGKGFQNNATNYGTQIVAENVQLNSTKELTEDQLAHILLQIDHWMKVYNTKCLNLEYIDNADIRILNQLIDKLNRSNYKFTTTKVIGRIGNDFRIKQSFKEDCLRITVGDFK